MTDDVMGDKMIIKRAMEMRIMILVGDVVTLASSKETWVCAKKASVVFSAFF